MLNKITTIIFLFLILTNLNSEAGKDITQQKNDAFLVKISYLPPDIFAAIKANRDAFFKDLDLVLKSEIEDSLILVDKKHLLDSKFAPQKIVMLKTIKNRAYKLDRLNIDLSALVLDPLQEMALAAKKDGTVLVVSSGYRSYDYQDKLFNRYVKRYGLAEASKFSASPGTSQHQLGTAIDFGTITDAYAETKAGKWLFKNAGKYGWSLSYPKGLKNITGYNWECWHYRYIGSEACKFQKKWFRDIQQYTLEVIHEWKNLK